MLKMRVREQLAQLYHVARGCSPHLRGRVVILAYHRVLSEDDVARRYVEPGMYVLQTAFEAQMRFVQEHFEILSLSELFERWDRDDLDPSVRYCVVTFDDGWLDNYANAYPVLRALSIPATIFLPTDFIGTDRWFWPDRLAYVLDGGRRAESRVGGRMGDAIERWKGRSSEEIDRALEDLARGAGVTFPRERMLLNWDEVTEMSGNGVSFGSHSCTHAILTTLTREAARREIVESLKTLRARRIDVVPVFCYPNGAQTEDIAGLVREAGYVGALTTAFGWEDRRGGDRFRLRRVGVHNDLCRTVAMFAFQVSGLNELMGGRARMPRG